MFESFPIREKIPIYSQKYHKQITNYILKTRSQFNKDQIYTFTITQNYEMILSNVDHWAEMLF